MSIKVNKIGGVNVKRTTYADNVRQMCIRGQFYTQGDCEDYEHMLSKVTRAEEFTDELLIETAIDIFNHSDIDRLMDECGADEHEVLDGIVHNLLNDCVYLVSTEDVEFD